MHGDEHGGFDVFANMHEPVTAARARLSADNARAEVERVMQACFDDSAPVYFNVPQDVAAQPVAAAGGGIAPAVRCALRSVRHTSRH